MACHWGVWVKPPAFWAIFPEVPPCGGKEPRMTCHSSGRIVTVPVYVSWDAEMLPPPKLKNRDGWGIETKDADQIT